MPTRDSINGCYMPTRDKLQMIRATHHLLVWTAEKLSFGQNLFIYLFSPELSSSDFWRILMPRLTYIHSNPAPFFTVALLSTMLPPAPMVMKISGIFSAKIGSIAEWYFLSWIFFFCAFSISSGGLSIWEIPPPPPSSYYGLFPFQSWHFSRNRDVTFLNISELNILWSSVNNIWLRLGVYLKTRAVMSVT